jgi:hypothetical protein
MPRLLYFVSLIAFCVAILPAAFAGDVRTDFDHSADFSKYQTYSWGKIQTGNPFYADRIRQAVDKQLQAKGWQLQPSNGAVTVFATDNIHNQKEVQTYYDNLGGGWGGGWGWDRWGWAGAWGPGGFGTSTSTTSHQPVASVVIDLFEANSKTLLWRGLATEDLSSNADKNTKMLDNDINNMFKKFPPKK